MNSDVPQVGLGIAIMKDGKLLMGKRKGSHAEGEYALPGGHFEYMESFDASARREIAEETGLEVGPLKFLCLMNLKDYAPKHYVEAGFVADWKSGEPKVLEPDRVESWDWYDTDHLPQPLFKTIGMIVEAMKTGRAFWDA